MAISTTSTYITYLGRPAAGYTTGPQSTHAVWTPYRVEHRRKRDSAMDSGKEWVNAKENGLILLREHWNETVDALESGISFTYVYQNQRKNVDQTTFQERTVRRINVPILTDREKEFPEAYHAYSMSELVTRAFAEANERELDILTSVAELGETVQELHRLLKAVARPITTLRSLAREIKKGDPRKTVDASASFWMTYRYGIMPNVYLIQDILAQFNRSEEAYSTVRKSSEGTPNWETLEYRTIEGPVKLKITQYITLESKYLVMLKRCYTIGQLLEKRFAFNPIKTGWELTTLSFVVDWFVGIGDAIDALTPTASSQQGFTMAKRYKLSQRKVAKVYVDDSAYQADTASIYHRWLITEGMEPQTYFTRTANLYNRQVGESLAPFFTVPSAVRLNWKRILDGFSLSWGSLRSHFKRK